jgi:hypothetical protein
VEDDTTVSCPEYGADMTVRESYYNRGKFISRHFSHVRGGEDCGGESKAHQQGKAIAASKLDRIFSHGDVTLEKQVGDSRIADILVEFPEPLHPYGHGVVCEVQHKNKGKELGVVTDEYFDNGYSVLWLWTTDFDLEEKTVEIPEDRVIPIFPNAVPEPSGRELYPDVTPSRLKKDVRSGEGPGVVPATFPSLVTTVHQFDVASPVRNTIADGWNRHEERGIHTKGGEKAWATVYSHEDLGAFLELREVNINTNEEEFLPVPIGPSDAEKLKTFCEDAASRIESDAVENIEGEWNINESVSLTYNAGLKGQLFFTAAPNREYKVVLVQHDIFGCQREFSLSYRRGDFERLSWVGPSLEFVPQPKEPLK